MISDHHERQRETPCLKEHRAEPYRLLISYESAYEYPRENKEQYRAQTRESNYRPSRERREPAHSLYVSGTEVICDQWHHSEADTESHIDRYSLKLQNDTHRSKRCNMVTVTCYESVYNYRYQIKKEDADRCRNTDHIKRFQVCSFELLTLERNLENGNRTHLAEDNDKVDKRTYIGQHRCDSRTQNFIALGQDHKHKERI